MIRRYFSLAVFILVILSFSNLSSGSALVVPVIFPDKELEEIVVWGSYQPADPGRVKAIEEEYRRIGVLKEGESFEEKHPEALTADEERFMWSGEKYCYEKKKNKEPVFDKRFRARLYDRRGKLLSEDFLRFLRPVEVHDLFSVVSIVSYIPYRKEGHRYRIVRLEGEKEVILRKSKVESKTELIRRYASRMRGRYNFNEKRQCHNIPGRRE